LKSQIAVIRGRPRVRAGGAWNVFFYTILDAYVSPTTPRIMATSKLPCETQAQKEERERVQAAEVAALQAENDRLVQALSRGGGQTSPAPPAFEREHAAGPQTTAGRGPNSGTITLETQVTYQGASPDPPIRRFRREVDFAFFLQYSTVLTRHLSYRIHGLSRSQKHFSTARN
jgi:hypothetical protein